MIEAIRLNNKAYIFKYHEYRTYSPKRKLNTLHTKLSIGSLNIFQTHAVIKPCVTHLLSKVAARRGTSSRTVTCSRVSQIPEKLVPSIKVSKANCSSCSNERNCVINCSRQINHGLKLVFIALIGDGVSAVSDFHINILSQ